MGHTTNLLLKWSLSYDTSMPRVQFFHTTLFHKLCHMHGLITERRLGRKHPHQRYRNSRAVQLSIENWTPNIHVNMFITVVFLISKYLTPLPGLGVLSFNGAWESLTLTGMCCVWKAHCAVVFLAVDKLALKVNIILKLTTPTFKIMLLARPSTVGLTILNHTGTF